jgi:hypothetical protein
MYTLYIYKFYIATNKTFQKEKNEVSKKTVNYKNLYLNFIYILKILTNKI